MGTGVHAHRSPDRAGHTGPPREATEARVGRPDRHDRQRLGPADPDPATAVDRLVDLTATQPATEHQGDAGPAGVGDEHVGPTAHDQDRHVELVGGAPDRSEVAVALCLHQDAGVAPDAQRRVAGEAGGTPHLPGAVGREACNERVALSHGECAAGRAVPGPPG